MGRGIHDSGPRQIRAGRPQWKEATYVKINVLPETDLRAEMNPGEILRSMCYGNSRVRCKVVNSGE
jgi:hypothetical protein